MKNQLNSQNFKNLFFKLLLIVAVLLTSSCSKVSMVKVEGLKCEYRTNPLGIDNLKPRLSWKLIEENKTRGF